MRRLLLTVGTIIGLAGPALAQVSEEWARCVNESGAYSFDVAIAACTAVINSGKETQATLAIAYSNRANTPTTARATRIVPSPITATRSTSIPRSSNYYNNRGVAYRAKGDIDRAIDDYSKAIDLNPKHVAGLFQPWQRLSGAGLLRRGDRRLQQGDRDRSQDRGLLLQPRHRLPGQGRQRPRHRRLRQGDRTRSQARAGLLQSRLRLSKQETVRRSHRRSHQGHRDRSPGCGCLQQPRLRISAEGPARPSHRGPHQGPRDQSQARERLQQPRRSLRGQEGVRARDLRLQQGHRDRSPGCRLLQRSRLGLLQGRQGSNRACRTPRNPYN